MLTLALAILALQDPAPAPAAHADVPRVLFFTHSAGFVHPVVKRAERAFLAHAEECFLAAAKPQFAAEASQDCAVLRRDNLAQFAAVVFYTTGELPLAAADKQGLLEFVRGGGGFVGIHCATDTFYEFAEYGEMIGGYFDGHPWHQQVRLAVEDRAHPTTFHLGEHLDLTDEIYQFRNWSRERVHVLLRLTDHGTDLKLGKRKDGDYALSWCRDYGGGRVFYTALGHRPEVWRDERFLSHLLAGVRWSMDAKDTLRRAPQGTTTTKLTHEDGSAPRWHADGDVLTITPGTGSLITAQPVSDCRIHVEFQVPAGDGQHGNSGIYIQRRYEVQILDSYGKPPGVHECGALYGRTAPMFNASLPAGTWQSYDIWFTAAKFDGDRKTKNARITVVHNGIVVHRDAELAGKTGAGTAEGRAPLPVLLQDHGSKVKFRNVWVQ